MGSYETVLGTITKFTEGLIQLNFEQMGAAFVKLSTFALGAIIGLKVFSKILKWMFKYHQNMTLAVLIGFMIGSLNKIWPWKEVLETRINSHGETVPFIEKSILPINFDGEPQIIMAILFICIGFLLIFGLEKLASRLGRN